MTPLEEIAAERVRQQIPLGWSDDHDDRHRDGSLAAAAASYAYFASMTEAARRRNADLDNTEGYFSILRFMWPESWMRRHWKPKDRRTDLIRAGALIVAELERMDRQAEKKRRSA